MERGSSKITWAENTASFQGWEAVSNLDLFSLGYQPRNRHAGPKALPWLLERPVSSVASLSRPSSKPSLRLGSFAGVRDLGSATATDLAALGAELRIADYARPETPDTAFQGVTHFLLFSSNALGKRGIPHRNV
jgi:hypothetical protein